MSDENTLRVRRAILRLKQKDHGEQVKVQWNDGDRDEMKETASIFGRKRKVGVRIDVYDQGMVLTRDDSVLESKYAVLDRLDVGGQHLFEVNWSEERAVRASVSLRARATGRRYQCNIVPTGIMVTRLDELVAIPGRNTALTWTKKEWDLSSLDRLLWIDLEPTPHQVSAARAAVTRTQIERGWALTTRYIGGRMRVIRLDHPDTGPLPSPASDQAVTAWATRHDLKGDLIEWRTMVDDARSLHLGQPPAVTPDSQDGP